MILSVTLNPSVDRAIYLSEFKLGDTNRVLRTETDAGGKGINLSRVADELGASTLATGFIGGGAGAFVKSVLDREHISYDFVEIEGETRINFSVEDESDQPPTTFNERGPTIQPAEWEQLLEKCQRYGADAEWACVGGSVPPGLEPDVYARLIHLFREGPSKILLDADGEALKRGLEAGPDLIKPNVREAERLLGRELQSDDACVGAVRELLGRGIPEVILSRGEEGAVLGTREGIWLGFSPKVEVFSTIGSGDSMLGAYLWSTTNGGGPEEAFSWALAAGAATATSSGSEIARQPVIERLLPQTRVEKWRS